MGLFGSKKAALEPQAGGEATLGSGERVAIARRVDCRGDSCPRPQLMTKKAVGEMNANEWLEVLVDNPTSVEALPPMCNELDATHVETIKDPACWRVYIRKD